MVGFEVRVLVTLDESESGKGFCGRLRALELIDGGVQSLCGSRVWTGVWGLSSEFRCCFPCSIFCKSAKLNLVLSLTEALFSLKSTLGSYSIAKEESTLER